MRDDRWYFAISAANEGRRSGGQYMIAAAAGYVITPLSNFSFLRGTAARNYREKVLASVQNAKRVAGGVFHSAQRWWNCWKRSHLEDTKKWKYIKLLTRNRPKVRYSLFSSSEHNFKSRLKRHDKMATVLSFLLHWNSCWVVTYFSGRSRQTKITKRLQYQFHCFYIIYTIDLKTYLYFM